MVAVTEPETVVRLDVPAGLVEARVAVENGRARHVTLRNVPSFLHARDRTVEADGIRRGRVRHGVRRQLLRDRRRGGGGRRGRPGAGRRLVERGAGVMTAINAADRPVHPDDDRIEGCHHVVFHAPGRDGADARAATSIHPGWLDRSPCGTGTSARMAQLHARGELRSASRSSTSRSSARASPAGSWRRRRSAGARRSSPRSPAAPGSPGWASTCWTPRTRSRPASRCERGRRGHGRRRHRRRDRRGGVRAGAGGARRRVTLVDRGEVASGTTGLGEGNVLALRQGRGARSST